MKQCTLMVGHFDANMICIYVNTMITIKIILPESIQKYRLRHSISSSILMTKSNNLISRNSLFKQLNINYGRNDYGNYGRNGLWTKRTMAEPEYVDETSRKRFKHSESLISVYRHTVLGLQQLCTLILKVSIVSHFIGHTLQFIHIESQQKSAFA